MGVEFSFVIPRRPVSVQTRHSRNLGAWKSFVKSAAANRWAGPPVSDGQLWCTLVYLYDEVPLDVDNIVKPILDALIGLVYENDNIVFDIQSHRRPLTGAYDLTRLPEMLSQALLLSQEFVYFRVADSKPIEEFLA